MITYKDQMDLFRLVGANLTSDVTCYAFGGTAMMFYGYKDETKDIDMIFEEEKQRTEFITALKRLGFGETSPIKVYIPEKLRNKHSPLMYKRDEIRFDLFAKQILHTPLSPTMKQQLFAVHDFKEKHLLRVNVLEKEMIVMLKAVTERQNDFDDIKTIVQKERTFNWQLLIAETLWQYHHGNSWVLLDMEKTLKELKRYVFVEEKYLKQLYEAEHTKTKGK